MLSSVKGGEGFGATTTTSTNSQPSSLLHTPASQSAHQQALDSVPKLWLHAFLQRAAASLPPGAHPLSGQDKRRLFDEIADAVESVLTPPDQYRTDFCYLETWCIYLELHFDIYQDEDECRRLWKYLKGIKLGIVHALFYLQLAAFEVRAGHPERAQVVLSSGIESLRDNEQLKHAQSTAVSTSSYLQASLDKHRAFSTPAAATIADSFARPSTARSVRRLGLGPPKRVIQDDSAVVPHHTTSSQGSSSASLKLADEPPASAENTGSQQPAEDKLTRSRSIKINNKPYRVLCLVGKGGSSRVFKVISGEGQVLALKRVSLKNLDDFTFNSYLNEIDLLQRFTEGHAPNIIQLHDSEVNRQSGHLSILMEYGEVDLSSLLKQNVADENFIKYYFAQMVRAVQSVHDAKIVHCDLKPANFLLVRGVLKLIDFGISKAILNDTTNIVRENQVGTVNYMSPEALIESNQAPADSQGKLKIGRSSDIWSLGCILYEMTHGAPPFAAFPTLLQRLKHIMDANYEVPIPASGNVYLDGLLQRCLLRNPRERPGLGDILQHAFLQAPRRAVHVSREQIEDLLRKFASSTSRQPDLLSQMNVAQVAHLIYEQWRGDG